MLKVNVTHNHSKDEVLTVNEAKVPLKLITTPNGIVLNYFNENDKFCSCTDIKSLEVYTDLTNTKDNTNA